MSGNIRRIIDERRYRKWVKKLSVPLRRAAEGCAYVYVEPAFAMRSILTVLEGAPGNASLASWYVRKRPEAFGEMRAGVKRNAIEVRELSRAIKALRGVPIVGPSSTQHRASDSLLSPPINIIEQRRRTIRSIARVAVRVRDNLSDKRLADLVMLELLCSLNSTHEEVYPYGRSKAEARLRALWGMPKVALLLRSEIGAREKKSPNAAKQSRSAIGCD